MKKISIILIHIIVSWLCIIGNAYSFEKITVKTKGVTNIHSNDKRIKIKIVTGTVKGETYEYIVKKLNIVVNGEDISVPGSVYSDLYEPHEAELLTKNHEKCLQITGSDGAESYYVQIYFDNIHVTRRVLFSSIIPDGPLEETKYWRREL